MASELETYDPEKLAAAMANLKAAVGALRRQVKAAQGGSSPVAKAVVAKPEAREARAVIREKARTGTLKPLRTPPPRTGPVGPRATGRVRLAEAEAVVSPSQELEAVEGWESLSDLAKQNEGKGRQGRGTR